MSELSYAVMGGPRSCGWRVKRNLSSSSRMSSPVHQRIRRVPTGHRRDAVGVRAWRWLYRRIQQRSLPVHREREILCPGVQDIRRGPTDLPEAEQSAARPGTCELGSARLGLAPILRSRTETVHVVSRACGSSICLSSTALPNPGPVTDSSGRCMTAVTTRPGPSRRSRRRVHDAPPARRFRGHRRHRAVSSCRGLRRQRRSPHVESSGWDLSQTGGGVVRSRRRRARVRPA